jgi:hypothetical protein
MSPEEIRLRRLHNQHVLHPTLTTAQEVVSYMAAMQAQEYAMARWAIALRMPHASDAEIEKDFNDGKILRTHILRPTWHFAAPQDIRWLLQLTAPRVSQANAFMYRKYGMDEKQFARTHPVLEKALQGNNYLTRDALREVFAKAGIDTGDSIKMSIIMMEAELAGLICSGPRQGNQFTYALLEERVPKVKPLSREEALALFCHRYFKSRGPASIKDFTTWSGLTVKEAKEGVAIISKELERFTIDGTEYYFTDDKTALPKEGQMTFLMPDYDEYGMGYKDRSVLSNPQAVQKTIFDRLVIVDGMVAGSWKRTIQKDNVLIEIQDFGNQKVGDDMVAAIEKYAAFLGKTPQYKFV